MATKSGLHFLVSNARSFRDKFKSKELAIWLFSMEDKQKVVDELMSKFHEVFGFLPHIHRLYYMDAEAG